jgi:membrane protein
VKNKYMRYFKNLIKRFNEDDVLALSSQLSYSLLFSFFPLIIFLMILIGLSSIRSEDVLIGLKRILPMSTFNLINGTIIEVVDTKKGHLIPLSLIFIIWSASTGFNAVIKALNKAYDEEEHRSFLKVQIIAVLFMLSLIFILVATILLLVFGEELGKIIIISLGLSKFFTLIWGILKYVIVGFAMILIFALLYHYTPCRRLKWIEVIPGSIFATMGWIIASIIFSFYVNNFANYSLIYGSLGAVVALLTWLFLSSIIIILGGELNAVISLNANAD